MQAKNSILLNFGQRLEFLRKVWGIKQQELAKAMKVKTNVAVSKYESGLRTPDFEKLINAIKFFRVSTDWLLMGMFENQKESLRFMKKMFDAKMLSVDAVAKKLGIPAAYLSSILNGKVFPEGDLYFEILNIIEDRKDFKNIFPLNICTEKKYSPNTNIPYHK